MMATNSNWLRMLRMVFAFIIFVSHSLLVTAQNTKIDSLKKVLLAAKEDTNKVNTLNGLSRQYYLTGNFDEAKKLAETALLLSEKLDFKKGIAASHNNLGNVYDSQGNYPKAVKEFFSALKIREKIRDKKGMAYSYNNLGNAYYRQGNYTEALKEHFASLKIKEEIEDKYGIAASHNNIGIIYESQGNYPEALKEHFAALKIREEIADKYGIATSHNNVGNVYGSQGNYPEALKEYFVALKIMEEIGDKFSIAASHGNIGFVYVKQSQPRKAKEKLQQGLQIAKGMGSKVLIKDSYNGLAKADSALGLWKNALENYKMYIVYRDSLINEENTKKTVQEQMNFEFDKQHASDSIRNAEQAEREKLRHNQELKQQRTYTYGGIIGFLLMMIVAGVSYRAYRQKQKANRIIAEQKKLVEEKQKDILDSIHYARRIQQSLLPTEKYIEKQLRRLRSRNNEKS
jgi:tetratricopeptide (TPR) repeat protein